MARLSFNNITPVDPFKELSNTTGNAADYFFGQAQALRQAEQQELNNRLAQQRLAEDRRINDSTIAARNFDLKTAQEAKADKQRIKDVITNTTKNADKHIRNYAFNKNQEYVATAGKSISDAYRGFAKSRGLTEVAPTVTAKEGTKEYQTQTAARDQWFTKHKEVSKEFDTKVRPLIQSTFLDKSIVDKSTAKAALTKRLLAQNVPIEQITATADALSDGYTDYAAANKAARETYEAAAERDIDLVKSLSGMVAKPSTSSTNTTSSTSGSKLGGLKSPSPIAYLEKQGMTFQSGWGNIVDSSPVPIQKAIEELTRRNYSYQQASEIVVQAALRSRKDNGNLDTDRFAKQAETVANETPIRSSTGGMSALTAYNKPKFEGINKLVNKAIAHSNAAMSTGLHTKVLKNKLSALQQFADKYSKSTPSVSGKSVIGKAIRNRGTTNPGNTTSNSSPLGSRSSVQPNTAPIGDGTAESLAMKALQNPKTQRELRDFLQLRTAARTEEDPVKAVELHNQVQKESGRFKNIKNIPTEQLSRLLDGVNQYRSGNIGPVQRTHGQIVEQIKAANEGIGFAEEDLLKAKHAYETTGLPQFKAQIEKLTQHLKGLEDHKQLWEGLLKGSNTSFLDGVANK